MTVPTTQYRSEARYKRRVSVASALAGFLMVVALLFVLQVAAEPSIALWFGAGAATALAAAWHRGRNAAGGRSGSRSR
jgi:hypothetical protein